MERYILERGYVTPNDEGIMCENDSRSIQKAVDAALDSGLGRVVIPRYNRRTGKCLWEVDKAIILDSNLEVVLDNCYIRQSDGSMDNVFRNFDDMKMRKTLAEEQSNIIIRGVGNAVIDGGMHNGLTQGTSLKDGLPHVEMNNVIRFHNLRNFRIENFTILNQRWWAINLLYAEEGKISGLNILCDNSVHNQDGIDLRLGCNNIIIENLFGQAGDDFIALTGFYGSRESDKYEVTGKTKDIHDIIIKNIAATSAECAIICLRNQDGVKMYNITIDTVHDIMSSEIAARKETSFVFGFDNNRYTSPKSPYAVVRVGQEGWINKRPCTAGDVYSIYVSNVHARCNCAVMLNMDIENSYFGNIYADNGVDRVISTQSTRASQPYGVNMRNTIFENIFYNCTDNEHSIAFDFDINTKECTLDNVTIRHAFVGASKKIVNMKHNGTLILSDIQGKEIESKVMVKKGAAVILNEKQY